MERKYQEEFIKKNVLNDPSSINYVLDQIKEVHSPDYGWEVSDPVLKLNPDGKTVTLKVLLTRDNKKMSKGRSI